MPKHQQLFVRFGEKRGRFASSEEVVKVEGLTLTTRSNWNRSKPVADGGGPLKVVAVIPDHRFKVWLAGVEGDTAEFIFNGHLRTWNRWRDTRLFQLSVGRNYFPHFYLTAHHYDKPPEPEEAPEDPRGRLDVPQYDEAVRRIGDFSCEFPREGEFRKAVNIVYHRVHLTDPLNGPPRVVGVEADARLKVWLIDAPRRLASIMVNGIWLIFKRSPGTRLFECRMRWDLWDRVIGRNLVPENPVKAFPHEFGDGYTWPVVDGATGYDIEFSDIGLQANVGPPPVYFEQSSKRLTWRVRADGGEWSGWVPGPHGAPLS